MPFRQLPASDPARTQALDAALEKSKNVTGTSLLISAATLAALQEFQPKWEKEVTERGDALGRQTAKTAELDKTAATLRLYVSHFIQVYQFGIERGLFSASGRAVYQLSVTEETVPNLDSESDLLLWADRIVKGDARRVTQFGEAAMAMPTAAEVAAELQDYRDKLKLQSEAKDKLGDEQADVNELRPEADKIIRDVWDEVEFALRQLEPATLRRRAREWGLVYVRRPGEPEEAPPSDNGDPAPVPTPA